MLVMQGRDRSARSMRLCFILRPDRTDARGSMAIVSEHNSIPDDPMQTVQFAAVRFPVQFFNSRIAVRPSRPVKIP